MLTPQQFTNQNISDGASHTLGSVYGSLTEAQAAFPHALSLDDELAWACIQKAVNVGRYDWNNAPGWDLGMRVVVPPGIYRINRTIKVASVRGLVIEGDGQSLVRWHGDNASPMFRCSNADHCELRRLWLMHSGGVESVLSAIDLVRGDANTWTPTACLFEEVRIGGFNLRTFKYGCRVLTAEGGDTNNDYHRWHCCVFNSHSEAGLLVDATQAHHLLLEDCEINGHGQGKCGIRVGPRICTRLMVNRCGGGGHTEMDFDFRAGYFNAAINHWNSEQSARLVLWGIGPTGSPAQLEITNSRWESHHVAEDGEIVRGYGPGPLTFRGNGIAGWNVAPKLRWWSNWTGAIPATVFLEGNVFRGTDDAFDLLGPLEQGGSDVKAGGNYRWSPGLNKYVSV